METLATISLLDHLVCSSCGKIYDAHRINTYASCCNQPLITCYNLKSDFLKSNIDRYDDSMWRYFRLLPVMDRNNIVSLHEGMTPVVELKKLASHDNNTSIFLKDESYNPTGSFKARGISMAVSKAKELGIDRLIIPTAGNAGGALAAYCAKADIRCKVVMPEQTPAIFKEECKIYGAELVEVNGLIDACAQKVAEIKKTEDYFDLSTLREPYRLEGKKTMGYEIAEQFNWHLPSVIVYPAGGGTGMIGIWKAFNEMLALGWIKKPLPKMVAVQSENCAPVAKAMKNRSNWKTNFKPLRSVANGLAVPFPFAMDLILQAIHESGGGVITVSEKEIIDGIKTIAQREGIFLSPEGSAAWKGAERFIERSKSMNEKVLFLNTGSGYKYMENVQKYL